MGSLTKVINSKVREEHSVEVRRKGEYFDVEIIKWYEDAEDFYID